jgi:hypothetical protein
MKLLELSPIGRYVFVGDTHGDFDASKKVIDKYLNDETRIVFLGDYVDRGPHSKANVDYLLEMREKNPGNVYLLAGNHEFHRTFDFHPADFWYGNEEKDKYSDVLEALPLVASIGSILALHGAPPNIERLEEVNRISNTVSDKRWNTIIWSDLKERGGMTAAIGPGGREVYGGEYFRHVMKKMGKKILIRSHDISAPELLFENRCLTVFTTNAYRSVDRFKDRERKVAIADFSQKATFETIDDLVLEEV